MTRPPWPFMSPLADPRVVPPSDQPEPQEPGRECPECHGDGGDKWNDYCTPCPMCDGERYL